MSNSPPGNVPPSLPSSDPARIGSPAPFLATPPPLPPNSKGKSASLGPLLASVLSLFIGLFLAEAIVSLTDDTLILFFDIHVLTSIRGMLFLLAMFVAVAIYCLMGLTPMIPKRVLLPLTLFNPAVGLLVIPLMIHYYSRIQQAAWIISFGQVLFGLSILCWVQGGFRFRWPLLPESKLAARSFGWLNLIGFLLVNLFLVLPGVVVYLAYCANLALNHFSDGFLTVRADGLTVQARKYVRDDGKTIHLFPMSHIGDSGFYQTLSQSFPTNSIILMEGVTDNKRLLTNRISYKRMATSIGVAEQEKEFRPRGEMVRADVDVEEFAPSTIDFLNATTLIHSKGLNFGTLLEMMQYAPPPHYEERLFEDLLKKRNRHLLDEIQARLLQSDSITVPWGAAHMPEIAKEIQKSGFRLVETRDHVAIRFRSAGNTNPGATGP